MGGSHEAGSQGRIADDRRRVHVSGSGASGEAHGEESGHDVWHGHHDHAGHDHSHAHPSAGHGHHHARHGHHGDHDHAAGHRGLGGLLGQIFHRHGESEGFTDPRVTATDRGIWALKVSIIGLLVTALLQLIVVAFSGSVALLADTIHNFADALTSVPLWIAFVLGRRMANRRYTYGYGRAEDIAGVLIIGVIFASAVLAGYEAYQRLRDPVPLASIVGFVGNEVVAQFRIRIGREIGSAALVADGQHARVDGLTSLSVLFSALGTLAGYPILDPIVGLLITVTILLVVRDAAKTVWERLMDAVDPSLVDQIETTARRVPGVLGVEKVRVRWLGHRLQTDFCLKVDAALSTATSHRIAEQVSHELYHALPRLADVFVHIDPVSDDGADHHALTAHHEGR